MIIKTVNEYYFYYCKHFNKRYSVPKILSDYESYRYSTMLQRVLKVCQYSTVCGKGRMSVWVHPQARLLYKSSLTSLYCNYCYSYGKYPPSALLTYSVHNVSATSHATSLLFSGSALWRSLYI